MGIVYSYNIVNYSKSNNEDKSEDWLFSVCQGTGSWFFPGSSLTSKIEN